jgi:hypothetical protein
VIGDSAPFGGYSRAAGRGVAGPPRPVVLPYLAMSWLIVERLRVPDVFTEARLRELVESAVEHIVPEG